MGVTIAAELATHITNMLVSPPSHLNIPLKIHKCISNLEIKIIFKIKNKNVLKTRGGVDAIGGPSGMRGAEDLVGQTPLVEETLNGMIYKE